MALGRFNDPRSEPDSGSAPISEGARRRAQKPRKNTILRGVKKLFDFVNPYPWMSEVEAMVHLELEKRGVPFSWRYFDAFELAPNLALLMPDFAPEFTLKEYKYAILIIGEFFGTLPTVLDRNAFAQVLLEEDGWTVAILFEAEIRNDVAKALDEKLPNLVGAVIKGPQRPNPYGTPDFMAKRRIQLAGQALAKALFKLDPDKQPERSNHFGDSGRARLRRHRRGSSAGFTGFEFGGDNRRRRDDTTS